MNALKSESNQQQRQQQSGSDPHSQHETHQPIAKRQRLGSSGEPLKITDLIDDCLKMIFKHLDRRSLFNVVVANGYLRPSAGVVYKRKFGTKKVRIEGVNGFKLFFDGSQIEINGLKTCLQYLRCLGSLISSLDIKYGDWNEKQSEHIHQYVNEYCAESLVKIKIFHKSNRISIKHFEKPFVNVHTVEVYSSDLGDRFPLFSQWFPIIRSLILFDARTTRQIETPLNYLEDLQIKVDNGSNCFTAAQTTRLLQLCPQLQNLEIVGYDFPNGTSTTSLLNMIKDNRGIRKLEVYMGIRADDVNQSHVQQIVNEHPSLVELVLASSKFTADGAISLIRQLNSLKLFRFQMCDRSIYDQLVAQLNSQWNSSFEYYTHVVALERRS